MYKEINLVITENSYLKSLESFNVELLRKDCAKVLQMKWSNDTLCPIRIAVLKLYAKEVIRLGKLKKITNEEKKVKLIEWLEEVKGKRPELFNEIGWWDLKVGKEFERNS